MRTSIFATASDLKSSFFGALLGRDCFLEGNHGERLLHGGKALTEALVKKDRGLRSNWSKTLQMLNKDSDKG